MELGWLALGLFFCAHNCYSAMLGLVSKTFFSWAIMLNFCYWRCTYLLSAWTVPSRHQRHSYGVWMFQSAVRKSNYFGADSQLPNAQRTITNFSPSDLYPTNQSAMIFWHGPGQQVPLWSPANQHRQIAKHRRRWLDAEETRRCINTLGTTRCDGFDFILPHPSTYIFASPSCDSNSPWPVHRQTHWDYFAQNQLTPPLQYHKFQPLTEPTPKTQSKSIKMVHPASTCCKTNPSGGCVCAAQAKCSCGKESALHCTCNKSTTENTIQGARCSCRMFNSS